MPDIAAFEVAIGLIFVFLVLSLVCTALMETISSVLAWRADYLKKGLVSLFEEDLAKQVVEHPLVAALVRKKREPSRLVEHVPVVGRVQAWWRRERYPSYLPSRSVVTALLTLDVESRATEASRALDQAVAAVPHERVREALTTLLQEAKSKTREAGNEVEEFRRLAERWYEDTMDRVSGWYRRRIQLVLWCIALFLAVVLNVDTVNVARVLWTDDAVRASIVAQAEQSAAQGNASDVEADVGALDIPLGWTFGEGGRQDFPSGWEAWVAKVLGLLLTAAALSLGAPFWFDLLGKVARLRSTGSPPPASGAQRAT